MGVTLRRLLIKGLYYPLWGGLYKGVNLYFYGHGRKVPLYNPSITPKMLFYLRTRNMSLFFRVGVLLINVFFG